MFVVTCTCNYLFQAIRELDFFGINLCGKGNRPKIFLSLSNPKEKRKA